MITDHLIEVIKLHAAAESPKEACGVLIVHKGRLRYRPCKNVHPNPQQYFDIDEKEWAAAEDLGEIAYIVHSHPFSSPDPSEADLVECERHQKPWLIINHPVGHWRIHEPFGYEAPYIGRTFSYGVLDCVQLGRDYYKRRLGIETPHIDSRDGWEDRGENLIEKNLEYMGFVKVLDGPKQHDIIGMILDDLSESNQTNHIAVFLGDNLILHHVRNRLSSRDIYGGWYRKCTSMILRHKSLL